MGNPTFLAFDVESGGIHSNVHSLLTAFYAVCDENWNVLDTLYLKVKPNDGNYVVTAEGMSINKIDLIAHDLEAMTQSHAGQVLRDFLVKNTNGGRVRLMPMGKNVGFDCDFTTDNILGKPQWDRYVSYRHYDITTMITLLKRKGLLAKDAPESLETLARYYNVQFVAHTADGDTHAGIEVVKILEGL